MYRLTLSGHVVECDTPEELGVLLSYLKVPQQVATTKPNLRVAKAPRTQGRKPKSGTGRATAVIWEFARQLSQITGKETMTCRSLLAKGKKKGIEYADQIKQAKQAKQAA
jgi:hypothetical protein